MTITVSALYDSYRDAAAAVERVEAAGVSSSAISLVSNDATADRAGYSDYAATEPGAADSAGTGAGLGAAVGAVGGLLAGLGIIAIPGVGPVVAAGWLASTLVGATTVGVAGGVLGALVGAGVDETDARSHVEGLQRGGTLVHVRVAETDAARIQAILDSGSAVRPSLNTALPGETIGRVPGGPL
ncbi:hypothetical protein E8L99_04430 [Phreatobacter aquaticus]|uniref:DUF1269 domain-containing protein n=1 Tax=Phreatobacter aquaticus TaxID=2570229 RepID=A0A4D7QCZ8_9HYPH|nr:hypothetical protein [Phreatobacter aquaticus]QCK85078.1 hypothetical protein E8L99_04430 [Phreatobacter aquaticus]